MDAIDLRDDLTWADLDGALRALREREPLHWSASAAAWIATGYAVATEVLRDGKRFRTNPSMADGPIADVLLAAADESPLPYQGLLAMLDEERHRNLRGLVASCYTAAAIERFRSPIRTLADALLQGPDGPESWDVIQDFARPLARAAVASPLGIEGGEAGPFIERAEELMELAQPGQDQHPLVVRAAGVVAEASDCLRELEVHARADGALAALMRARAEGELSGEDYFGLAVFLAGVGQGPMSLALGNGLLALIRNEEQQRRVWATADGRRGFLDESLRFAPPIQVLRRFAAADTTLAGKQIRKGAVLEVVVPAVNRDPAAFGNPHRFDVERGARDHLGFGWGPHMCLGAPLARLIAEEALGAFAEVMPQPCIGDRLEILTGETTGPLHMDLLTGAAGGSCPVTGARNLADASVPAVAQNHACPCGSG
ncbi:MAG: cytochrome P450 [Dehalococcoidia bacterium]